EVNLGTLSGSLSVHKDMEFVEEGGDWYALLINDGSNELLRLDFGSDLTNTSPIVTDLSSGLSLSGPRGLSLANDDGDWVAVIASNNSEKLTIVRFGASITNTPSQGDVINLTDNSFLNLFDLDLIEISGRWYGMLASNGNGKIYRLEFGEELYSAPLVLEQASISGAISVKLLREGDKHVAITQSRSGGVYQMVFAGDLTTPYRLVETGNGSGLISDSRAMDVFYYAPEWYGYTVDSDDGQLSRVLFQSSCTSPSITSSTLFEPVDLYYEESGEYTVSLTGISPNGNRGYVEHKITVTNDQAPDISLSTDNSCISTLSQFTSINTSGDITSYSWDFDGDG
ncbi:MAG: hypothetical protein JXR10_14095, partial [Cyclobacteriaceae bacterium]